MECFPRGKHVDLLRVLRLNHIEGAARGQRLADVIEIRVPVLSQCVHKGASAWVGSIAAIQSTSAVLRQTLRAEEAIDPPIA